MIQNKMLMKCFVIGILVVFVGTCVVPSCFGQSENEPPVFPVISGPHYGKVNTEYTFTASLTTPEGDQYFMVLNWGDENFSDWHGPLNPGEPYTFTHSWSEPGNYSILMKIRDIFGSESEWTAPFFITIVKLHPGFFFGSFNCITLTEDLVVLGSRSFFVFPAIPAFYKNATIILSIDSLRYPGTSFTFGVGGVAMIIPSGVTIRTITTSPTESVQLIINDDGSGDPTDKNVNVPVYSPDSGITPTLTINFTITGINNTQDTAYYGDDIWEDWRNITIGGDILYPVNGTTLSHVGTKGDWNCRITPTKPYGVISLRIDWPGNGSANNSIQIVNGTYVTPFVDSFPWGQDFNLTVTVRDIDSFPVKNAEVYLIWEEDDTEFNHTSGNNKPGNGMNGEYTFWITKEDQGVDAPKNITIAAQWYKAFWGYTKVAMTQPAPSPILEIGTITNGFGTKVQIKNTGTANATNVSVNINFSGAWMILPRAEHYQTVVDIDAGLSENISVIVFGLGKTTITVEATCAEGSSATKTVTGTVFLFFILGIK